MKILDFGNGKLISIDVYYRISGINIADSYQTISQGVFISSTINNGSVQGFPSPEGMSTDLTKQDAAMNSTLYPIVSYTVIHDKLNVLNLAHGCLWGMSCYM